MSATFTERDIHGGLYVWIRGRLVYKKNPRDEHGRLFQVAPSWTVILPCPKGMPCPRC